MPCAAGWPRRPSRTSTPCKAANDHLIGKLQAVAQAVRRRSVPNLSDRSTLDDPAHGGPAACHLPKMSGPNLREVVHVQPVLGVFVPERRHMRVNCAERAELPL